MLYVLKKMENDVYVAFCLIWHPIRITLKASPFTLPACFEKVSLESNDEALYHLVESLHEYSLKIRIPIDFN